MEQKKNPPACPAAKKCGGCQLANMDYEQQLRYKQGKAISLLGAFGHVEPILGMDEPYHYRCKVQAAFSQGRGGILSGVWQSSSRRVVPIDSCLLEDELADRIVVTVLKKKERKLHINPRRQGLSSLLPWANLPNWKIANLDYTGAI